MKEVRIIDEMNDENKEYYIEQVEKYDIQKSLVVSGGIALQISVLSFLAVGAFGVNVAAYLTDSPSIIQIIANTVFAGLSIYPIITMVKSISKIAKINIDIDAIKIWFAQHGLVLEDELADSKGRGR